MEWKNIHFKNFSFFENLKRFFFEAFLIFIFVKQKPEEQKAKSCNYIFDQIQNLKSEKTRKNSKNSSNFKVLVFFMDEKKAIKYHYQKWLS